MARRRSLADSPIRLRVYRAGYAPAYGAVFPGPKTFGAAQSAFWFDATRLADPVRRDASALRSFLAEADAQVIVPKPDDQTVSAKVRAVLRPLQSAWPDLQTVAAALRMAAPTLQRHLASEGTSFQSLKDEVRRDLAILRLRSSNVALKTLASELGFSDSSAFHRAFRDWTGSAPSAYRRNGR